MALLQGEGLAFNPECIFFCTRSCFR